MTPSRNGQRHLANRERTLRPSVFIPDYRLAEIVAVAASARLSHLPMAGTKLKWRKGTVQHLRLATRAEE